MSISLRKRIELVPTSVDYLNEMSVKYHYMHQKVHPRASPFGWLVKFDGEICHHGDPCGFIIFATPHFTKLKGEFGYPDLPTKWQVLMLSRLWLNDLLPKNSETCVIAKSLKLVQERWLKVHPPRFLNEPYHILKIISFADTHYHEGTIYKAANFRRTGETVSRRKHRGTRGVGSDGHRLVRFVYDLPHPKWEYTPTQVQISFKEA